MATRPFTADDPALPMNYPGFVFRALLDDGFQAADILAGTGLQESFLDDPDVRISFRAIARLFQNGVALSEDPHLGPKLAKRFQPSSIGLPAFTAMSAACFRDGLEVLQLYLILTFSTVEFVLNDDHTDEASVSLRPRLEHGANSAFIFTSAIVICDRLCRSMLGASQAFTRAELALPTPSDATRVEAEVGLPICFEAAQHRLYFPAALLSQKLPNADPINHKRLLSICEQLAAKHLPETAAYSQVLAYLTERQRLNVLISDAAAATGYSERGLRRQLEKSGTSYRDLLDKARHTRARWALANTTRSIQEIAFELGFDSASNFARSFKRWTGQTPRNFRDGPRATSAVGQK